MKKLEFKTTIAASRQKVWDTMLDPQTYKEWTGVSWPGSYFEGKWAEGENLQFISPDGSGTLAKLAEHRPYEFSRPNISPSLHGAVGKTGTARKPKTGSAPRNHTHLQRRPAARS